MEELEINMKNTLYEILKELIKIFIKIKFEMKLWSYTNRRYQEKYEQD